MAHYRQTIRERVTTILTGLNTTGSNVFESRYYPVEETNLPCLCVYTISETSEVSRMNATRALTRVLELAITGVARVNSTLDTTLDTIAAEVEAAIGADTQLNLPQAVYDCTLTQTRVSLTQPAGDKQTGVVELIYNVTYRTLLSNPAVAAA